MTKSEILERGIIVLRQQIAGLWQDLSSGDITPAARAELRARMVKASGELRLCLKAYDLECRRLRERDDNLSVHRPVQWHFVDTDYANSLQPN